MESWQLYYLASATYFTGSLVGPSKARVLVCFLLGAASMVAGFRAFP